MKRILSICILLLTVCGCMNLRKTENPIPEGPRVFFSDEIQDSLNVFMDAVDSCDVFSIWMEKDKEDTLLYFIAFEAVYPSPLWYRSPCEEIFRPQGAIETDEGEVIALAYIGMESFGGIVNEDLYSKEIYDKHYVRGSAGRRVYDEVLPSQRVYRIRNRKSLELLSIHKSGYEKKTGEQNGAETFPDC